MDTVEFLGLKSSHNPFRWHLEVVPHISTSVNFLFGGCGLVSHEAYEPFIALRQAERRRR